MEEIKKGFILIKDNQVKKLKEQKDFYPVSEVKENLTTPDEFLGYIISDGLIIPCFKNKIVSDKLDKILS